MSMLNYERLGIKKDAPRSGFRLANNVAMPATNYSITMRAIRHALRCRRRLPRWAALMR